MKFRKIEFRRHPILGDIVFDFTDDKGNTIDTIILAGENGCGKSVLLNSIFDYAPFISNKDKEGEILTEIELLDDEMSLIKSDRNFDKNLVDHQFLNIISIHQNFDNNNLLEPSKVILKEISGKEYFANGYILGKEIFKIIFSDVEINFTPKTISNVTSKNIDELNQQKIKSDNNIATNITQLLIDIDNLDSSDLANWVDLNQGQAPPQEIIKVRMKRFTKAFHSMFPNKRFVCIKNNNGYKEVIFNEFGKEMPIGKLSSGEKQIVFRGGFLLKDKKSTEGAVVLIDEPEISLHPRWQLEIMNFLKTLFTDEHGNQTSQLIVATHSPFVIHNCTRNNDKVIVLQKDSNGKFVVSSSPEYYSWTESQVVEKAFNVSYMLDPSKTTVFVEGATDEKYYSRAMDVFEYDKSKIVFKWIGQNVSKGNAENTGDKALNSAMSFFKANLCMINSKVALLYDSDTSKPEEDIANKLFIRTMPKKLSNELYKKGIENLLVLPADFNKDNYYSTRVKEDDYGAESIIKELDKTKLCDYICGLPEIHIKDVLANLRGEIDRLLSI